MTDPEKLPESPLDFPLVSSFDHHHNDEPNLDELKNMFETMGLALPDSLTNTASSSSNPNTTTTNLSASTANDNNDNRVGKGMKLRVRLPDGTPADLIIYPEYDIDSQITVFMSRFGIENNATAKAKLVEVVHVALKLEVGAKKEQPPAATTKSSSTPPSNTTTNTTMNKDKKVRLKLKLPNGNVENVDLQIASTDKVTLILLSLILILTLTI